MQVHKDSVYDICVCSMYVLCRFIKTLYMMYVCVQCIVQVHKEAVQFLQAEWALVLHDTVL